MSLFTIKMISKEKTEGKYLFGKVFSLLFLFLHYNKDKNYKMIYLEEKNDKV